MAAVPVDLTPLPFDRLKLSVNWFRWMIFLKHCSIMKKSITFIFIKPKNLKQRQSTIHVNDPKLIFESTFNNFQVTFYNPSRQATIYPLDLMACSSGKSILITGGTGSLGKETHQEQFLSAGPT